MYHGYSKTAITKTILKIHKYYVKIIRKSYTINEKSEKRTISILLKFMYKSLIATKHIQGNHPSS